MFSIQGLEEDNMSVVLDVKNLSMHYNWLVQVLVLVVPLMDSRFNSQDMMKNKILCSPNFPPKLGTFKSTQIGSMLKKNGLYAIGEIVYKVDP